ncbi:Spc98 family-domain-containing protein [Lasiosphaeria hispida]|uniref:Spindle pole body component n=1 Tax=Lasiosphaeria hispida TaxID=260671 RepID=A0AAJ0HGP7_9PEZI|nr:Spc98 family-domain-containing protein [Lasiosphaeria hispida]
MANDKDAAGLFAIPDFWQSSSWLEQSILDINRNNPLFSLDLSQNTASLVAGAKSRMLPVATPTTPVDDGFFRLPTVLKELAHEDAESQVNEDEPGDLGIQPGAVRIVEEDLWLSGKHDTPNPPECRTWDKFNQAGRGLYSPAFITEAGPAAFDSLMKTKRASPYTGPDVVPDASYSACLLTLALGRSSLLFSWSPEENKFFKTVDYLRTSGLSLESMQSVDKLCLECANATRHLQAFAEKTYSAPSTPTRVALAGVIDRLVAAVQSKLSSRGRTVKSIIQLQSAVQPVHTVLTYIEILVKKLAQQKSDEGMLSSLFEEAQSAEYRSILLREVTREVLRLVSKPWAAFVEEWIGLKAEEGAPVTKAGPSKAFIKVADKVWIDDLGYELEEADFFLDEEKMPSFIPDDVAQTTFETGRNIRFLREHHPEHPLSQQQTITISKPPRLEWQFEWDAITQLEKKINEYRNALSSAIRTSRLQTELGDEAPASQQTKNQNFFNQNFELEFFGKSDSQIEECVLASLNQLDQPMDNYTSRDGFSKLFRDRLYQGAELSVESERLSPHWSLVPLLSFSPVIGTQSRLVSQECMKLLFSSHELRVHIDLLKQYYLLGNGLLCSRLSHALFDPELETAERHAGVALGGGVMGLRLGGRENWPPASSELRLALMGVLSESYETPPGATQTPRSSLASRTFNSDLPGDLSFAVRDLSPEEIDRCMDPDSLEALDFLRLSYKAPSPLRPIMTPTVLVKYDRIFMSLLRILRMLYVVNELFHDIPLAGRRGHEPSNASLRFCIESRHFVRQIAAYFFDTGITAPWRRFETWLDTAEAESLGATDGSGLGADGSKNCSPDILRDRLEQVLDGIMTVMLLRKRQQPVLKLLEETFAVILRFSKQLRVQAHGDGTVGHDRDKLKSETPEKLYSTFKKKVEVFLTVCRGLNEKTGVGSKGAQLVDGQGRRERGIGNPIDQLLLLMDMSGFYARKPTG